MKKRKKLILVILFISLILVAGIFLYFKFFPKQLEQNQLPAQYKDCEILAKKEIKEERLIQDDLKEMKAELIVIKDRVFGPVSIGFSKIIFLFEDGYFLELPGYGYGLRWWRVGNLVGKQPWDLEVAVMYEGGGSGSFAPFYFYRWNGVNFEIEFQNRDLFNENEMVDLDNDGILEIVHTFRLDKFAFNWREVYKWDDKKMEFVKANNLFPEVYENWIKEQDEYFEKQSKENPKWYDSPFGKSMRELEACLREKAQLNLEGVFGEGRDCL